MYPGVGVRSSRQPRAGGRNTVGVRILPILKRIGLEREDPATLLHQLRSDGVNQGATVVDEDELISLNAGEAFGC